MRVDRKNKPRIRSAREYRICRIGLQRLARLGRGANLRMHSLDRLRSIDGDKLSQLQSLYGKTSRKGSRHSQPRGSVPPTYDELCEHVEILRVDFKF